MNRFDRSCRLSKTAVLGIGYCVVLTLSACGSDGGDQDLEMQAVERGEQVFVVNCGPCHGPGGGGPALEQIMALSPAERGEKIRNHPLAGRIPQRLPANELLDVIEYFGPE